MITLFYFCCIMQIKTIPTTADKYGRKGCLRFAAILFAISVTGMATAQNYGVLLFFRLLTGIGVGLGLSIDPLYIGEVSPSEKRGRLISWCELSINLGTLLGFGFGALLNLAPVNVGWRIMLALGAIMPVALLVCLMWMPETPRWLVLNNREIEAKAVLVNIYDSNVDTQELLEEIKTNITEEAKREGGWDQIYRPTPAVRRALIAGVGQGVLQQLTGIEAIMNYFIFMFEAANVRVTTAYTYLVVFGFCKFATVAYVSRLFDNPEFGRKKMLLFSGFGVAISMLVYAIVYSPYFSDEEWVGPVLIITMFFYVIMFSVGWGPCTWIVIAEVFPTHIRAKGVSCATFGNRLMATILTGSFLTLVKYISYSGIFIIFLVCGRDIRVYVIYVI